MKQTAIVILTLVGMTIGCTLFFAPSCNSKKAEVSQTADTSYAQVLRQRAEQLTKDYNTKAASLQTKNDSLSAVVTLQQSSISGYRTKARSLEKQLIEQAEQVDAGTYSGDSLAPSLEQYIAHRNVADSLCDESITALKEIVGNKDEELVLCRQSNSAIRDLSREQDAQMQRLSAELTTAYKTQKRKTTQNRLLAAGLLIVTGFASAVLISKPLK